MLPVARLHGSRGDEFALVSVVKGWQVRQGFIFVTVNGEPDNSNLSICLLRYQSRRSVGGGGVGVKGPAVGLRTPDCGGEDGDIRGAEHARKRTVGNRITR